MANRSKPAGAKGRSSRLTLPLLAILFVGGAAASIWYAKSRDEGSRDPRGQVTITQPGQDGNDVVNRDRRQPIDPNKDPLRQALDAQLAPPKSGETSAFPSGTRVVSLRVKDGTALLELSPEINKLSTMGSTGESLAYDALRKVFAQFAHVQRMSVMVEGKVFEGEHSGPWAEVQVRDDHARIEDRP